MRRTWKRGRRARRLTVIASALLVAMLASACGSSTPTLNSARVERAVAASILQERGLHTTVVCPPDVPRKAGRVFTCTARLDAGTYPITVTETNGSGHVRYENSQPLIALNVAKVRRAIATSISQQRGLSATVSCPAEVLQREGVQFTCTAVLSGQRQRYPFVVSEVDGKGHVRYVGQ
jgi:Domain of unknown function (DUF4333)